MKISLMQAFEGTAIGYFIVACIWIAARINR